VQALVGRDPVKTAERARRFAIPHACTSMPEVLDLAGVDAVTIATPPHTHVAIAHQVIAAGRHVLCEKPFTRDAAEARELLAAAEAAGVVQSSAPRCASAPDRRCFRSLSAPERSETRASPRS
jgi:predicted dehydrogenase